jgi:hypothetical protein
MSRHMACRSPARKRQRRAVSTAAWATYMREASRLDRNTAFAAISRIEKALPQRSPQQQDLARVESAIRDISDMVQWLAGALGAQKLP